MRRRKTILAGICAGVAWMAPDAAATDYCVAPNTTCGGTNAATFEAALDDADSSAESDRIFLGAATYVSPDAGYIYNNLGAPVEIVGAGRDQTILTSPIGASFDVLALYTPAGSSIHDLTVRLPQNAAASFVGLLTKADVRRVDVTEAVTQTNSRLGILVKGGIIEDSTVALAGTPISFGVQLDVASAVRGSTFRASNPLRVEAGGTIERSVLAGSNSGVLTEGNTTITDSLITLASVSGYAINGFASSGSDGTVNTDGVTVIGSGGADSGGVYASNQAFNTQKSTVNLVDTVIRGFGHALNKAGFGTGQVNINVAYSDYDPSGNIDSGPGAISPTNVTNLGDAHFVNATAGDYRLRGDSPLIDIGEPGAPTSLTDLAGLPRLVDGDAIAGARRDIGAYEYQAQPPVASISGPATAETGHAVLFSGTGSTDADGDPLTHSWTLDGAAAGSEATLAVTFKTPGSHVIGLTVTDPSGRQAGATHTVTVTGAPVDETAPTISNLRASPARTRRGRPISFRFGLDEAAGVQLKIFRLLPGRREGTACRKPSKRNRKAKHCTRRALVKTLTGKGKAGANRMRFSGKVRGRALAKGRYQAVLVATDTAGNRSASKRVAFTII